MDVRPGETRPGLSAKIDAIPVDPVEMFASEARFSRLIEGRLRFYDQDILWFDSIWLIQNELGRIVGSFHDKPLKAYGLIRFEESLSPHEVLARLDGSLFSRGDAAGMRRFAALVSQPIPAGKEKRFALEVADAYAPVLRTLDRLGRDLPRLVPAP